MCGFAGFLDPAGASPEERRAIVTAMGAPLRPRGPDDEQVHVDDTLALVFRRLSIVDRVGGGQPMWNERRTLCLVANGEIYNHAELRAGLREPHRFRSASDCEVILHLYEEHGADCVRMLNGIFAFAIWDREARRLFFARDRLGVKPFFYAEGPPFLFGSELKALLMHPAAPRFPNLLSWKSLDESTVLGIRSLPGGCHGTWTDGRVTVTRYWSVAEALEQVGPSDRAEDYVERYAELVESAVHMQLMSDVPVGVALSGGLDSSVLTVLAARENRNLLCFSVVDDEDESGDGAAAAQVAALAGIHHHRIRFGEQGILAGQLTLEDLERMVWVLEGPYGNPETWSKLLSYERAHAVVPEMKVLLLGQGADELAGGYTRQAVIRDGAWAYAHPDWPTFLRRNALSSLPPPFRSLIRPDLPFDEEQVYRWYARGAADHMQKYNLWHEDRTTASQSLEARVPFLDPRLVDLLLSIPHALRPTLLWDKEIERRAAARWLPEALVRRHKVGYIKTTGDRVQRALSESLCAIYPAFEERYLGGGDPVLAVAPLRAAVDRLRARPTEPDFDLLFLSMQFAVFLAQCQRPRDYLGLAEAR